MNKNFDIYADGGKLDEMDPSMLEALIERQKAIKKQNNPYMNGIDLNIPDEYVEDFFDEYDRSDRENSPLLKYILMKHAQEGFKNGPIGTDGYYEQYDPEINPDLKEDYENFLNSFYNNSK